MIPQHAARWLTLHQLARIGPARKQALLASFGSIDAVFAASRTQLAAALVGRPEAVDAILAGPDASALARELDWIGRAGHHLLTWADVDYPPLLREIADPPLVLYVHGDRSLLGRLQLAIVGSRNPTPGGRENARAFGCTLAGAGWVITSGLALGIDGAAHRGALEAGGATIGVAGTGLDRVYPARHRDLAHEIAEKGALVSEFPLGTPPRAENFPVRNRIISGLSLGTLVVEAAIKSGSLITARLAAEQGREVFAVPGSIHSPLSRGCHALIRQGAKLVETAHDIIEEVGPLARVAEQARPVACGAASASSGDPAVASLDEQMSRLLACLGYDPATIDALVERSGLTPDIISSMLLQLELKGFVEACPGGKYLRISSESDTSHT